MSLSICMLTREPPARVAALLEPLREYADEIVIAANSMLDEPSIAGYTTLADRVFQIDHHLAERHLPWLYRQCSGDWILRLDADEAPSSEFLRSLPALLAARDVQQYWLGRSWLYPDAVHTLAEEPWSEDFVNRLTRNDGTLHISGRMHTDPDPITPRRYLPGALYHLDLLLTSTEQRREKAERYEAEGPGLLTHDGAPLNEAFYLPELREELTYDDVPTEDRALIGEALSAPARASRGPEPHATAPEPRHVSLAEMDLYWDGREVGEDAYRALIEPYRPAVSVRPAGRRAVFVYATNLGDVWWPANLDDGPSIRLGYRWLNLDGTILEAAGPRSPFLSRVPPGERVLVPVDVVAPADPGEYLLEVDIVHEYVRWFDRACRIRVLVAR